MKNKETQLQRVVRKQREGKLGGGSVHISLNGFSADQFFENKKELKKVLKYFLKNSDGTFDILMSLNNEK